MPVIKIRIEGKTPLLQHRMTEEELFGLLGTKTNRKTDKVQQTPREIAEKYAYKNDDDSFYIPTEYILGAIAHVAGDYKQKNSIRKSLKAIIKGAVRPTADRANLETKSGKPVKKFEVDVRRATNHQKGAVAVCRPRFDDWSAEFELDVDTDMVSKETLLDILNDSGKRAGIGSFRVQRGGYFGQFQVTSYE